MSIWFTTKIKASNFLSYVVYKNFLETCQIFSYKNWWYQLFGNEPNDGLKIGMPQFWFGKIWKPTKQALSWFDEVACLIV